MREAEEPFAPGQKGSSAMPHKRNPVTCEQICGLARVVRANVQAAFENIALWHERDISHSSVERVILPDSTILADYLLAKTTWLVDDLLVYPERMRATSGLTRGLIFSGQLLLDLAAAGMLREAAYKLVQAHAMQAWRNGPISARPSRNRPTSGNTYPRRKSRKASLFPDSYKISTASSSESSVQPDSFPFPGFSIFIEFFPSIFRSFV